MNKWMTLTLCAFFFCAPPVFAGEVDYQAEGGGRSYPYGGLLSLQSGYGLELWRNENKNQDKNFWQYGYIRPAVLIDTAAVVNREAIEVEIYPIAIWGFAGGAGLGQRTKNDYTDFDCSSLMCDQNLTYHYLRTKLILGYAQSVLIVNARYDFFHTAEGARPFYDEMSYLVGQPGGDDLRTLSVLGGQMLTDEWSLGALGTFQNFVHSRANNSSVLGLVNYSWKNGQDSWRATIGAGTFLSSVQRTDWSAVFSVHWTGAQGLSLF